MVVHASGDRDGRSQEAASTGDGARATAIQPPHRRRRLYPPRSVRMVVVLCLLAVLIVRGAAVTGDPAIVNVLTLIGGVIAFCVLAGWFVFRSGYSRSLRVAGALAIVVVPLLGFAAFEIDQVTGALVPTFRPRWRRAPDELLQVPAAERPRQVDLVTTTEQDFPQFLGPERNLRVKDCGLARDWSNRPPRRLWMQPIGAGWSAFAIVNGYAVTMEQRGTDELVTCYEARTGQWQWSHSVKARHSTILGGVGPRCTPTIHEGRVYALGATGVLRCLDGASGKEIWSDDLLARFGVEPSEEMRGVEWGRAASPLILDQLLIVPAGGPHDGRKVSLAAFHKDTGQLVWQAGERQISYSSPAVGVLAGERQILIVNEDNVSAHDPRNGRILWEYIWPGNSASDASVSQAVFLDGDRVFLSKGYFVGAALLQITRGNDGSWNAQKVWYNSALLRTKFTNVVMHNGFVYGLSEGILECGELDSGKRQWKKGRYGQGQLLGVGDLLLVQAESGEVAMLEADPKAHRELGIFAALEGKTWNNLSLYGNLLLVRNAEVAAGYELPLTTERTHALAQNP